MERPSGVTGNWAIFTLWIVILAGLYIASRYNYLLFHSLAEIFSIFVACGIFVVAWNSRRFMDNNYLLFLGIAYLFIGGLDLAHTLAYKGMGIFSGYDANLPTQLWISARYLESMSLLIAPLFIPRKPNTRFVFVGYALLVFLMLASIFYWNIFPDCFIEGTGLTRFKKISEYFICLMLMGSILLLFQKQKEFDKNIFWLLIASIILTICSELAFTFYIRVYDLSNLTGHFLKLASFYLIYKSIIESGFVKPYSLLFRNLKQREEELHTLNLELEKRVDQRTADLQKEVMERKHAQEEVLKTKNRLQSVFDGISEPLLLLDSYLTVKMLNKAAVEYYKINGKNVIEKPCYRVFKDGSKPCEDCNIAPAVLEGRHLGFERKGFMNPERLEQVVIYPLKETYGEFGSAIIRISDITESKMSERQLIQREKMAALGVLISGIAHEINNPNNYISVNIPILRDYLNVVMPLVDEYAQKHPDLEILYMPYPEFREDIFELLDNVQHGSRQIKAIVRDLKVFSKPGEDKRIEKIDLKPIIEKVVAFCRSKIKRTVKTFNVHIPESLPEVLIDSQSLEQILINLLINAAQAFEKPMDENSNVNLVVSMDNSKENRLIIEVSDNGGGMDEKTLGKIFTPFFTTKSSEDGIGLGLYIVQNLIEKMGGCVEVESKLGSGSNFRIILDL
ncbi:MAG TPA: MASE3 domain-containing protein [Desulfobacterales bacterium]|nr:MASE3 domain-containing protein [Desulfobacterales bacterium]